MNEGGILAGPVEIFTTEADLPTEATNVPHTKTSAISYIEEAKSLAEIIELHHAPSHISSWPLCRCLLTSHVGFESLLYCWYHEAAAAVIPLHRHHANCHFVHSVRSYRADV